MHGVENYLVKFQQKTQSPKQKMKMFIAIVGVFADKKTPKGKRNKTAEPPQYQRNIKKQLHPEDERLEPENKSPGISENHLNQTIIFRF